VFLSTVVGMEANVWLEQSTVIFESLQMHWHFLGQVLAAAVGRNVVVGNTVKKMTAGTISPVKPDPERPVVLKDIFITLILFPGSI
jgi:hypothetical protein